MMRERFLFRSTALTLTLLIAVMVQAAWSNHRTALADVAEKARMNHQTEAPTKSMKINVAGVLQKSERRVQFAIALEKSLRELSEKYKEEKAQEAANEPHSEQP